jgi:hypothetical protein
LNANIKTNIREKFSEASELKVTNDLSLTLPQNQQILPTSANKIFFIQIIIIKKHMQINVCV